MLDYGKPTFTLPPKNYSLLSPHPEKHSENPMYKDE